MYLIGCPYPMTIEWVPAETGGDGAVVNHGEIVRDPIVPTQRTKGMSAHTRSRVTALGRITRELKYGQLRGIPNLML